MSTRKILLEAALVGVLGVAFAFLANQISPRGLNPARNYFPGGDKPSPAPPPPAAPPAAPGGTNLRLPPSVRLRLAQGAAGKETACISWNAPRWKNFSTTRAWQQNVIMFVDARDEDDYQAGPHPGRL